MLTRTAILFTLIAGLSVPTVADAGVSLQGVSLQGVSLQGVSLQGVSLQGVSLEGVQLRSNDMFNVSVYRTQLRGYRYDDDGILEYRYPNRYRRYVDGTWSSSIYESLAGTYMKGVLSNGETRWMYLYTVRQSDSEDKNTMAKDAHKSNRDVWLYKFLIYTDGGWDWACPGTREGMFLNGTWNQDGTHSTDGITFACNSGVVAKCARGWGYKPWKTISDSAGRSHQLGALHQACVRAAMSDYCGLGEVAESDCLTRNNTAVDMWDKFDLNQKVSEDAANGMFAYEATYWGGKGNYMSRTRHEDLPGTLCVPSELSGFIGTDLLASGWEPMSEYSVENAYGWPWYEVAVATITYCGHSVDTTGARLALDCNTCTRDVCAVDSYCCDTQWDSICVSEVPMYCSSSQQSSSPMP